MTTTLDLTVGIGPNDASTGHFLVPFSRNNRFTGRVDILHKLSKILSGGTRGSKSVALYGLPGCGKTQIAVEYAHHHRKRYSSVFWVDGSTRQKLVSGYVDIALKVLKVSSTGENPVDSLATKLKLWFESDDLGNGDWLLIVDGADEVDKIQEFLPMAGNVLLTTRDKHAGGGVACYGIEIKGMAAEESVKLLFKGMDVQEQEIDPESDPARYGFVCAIVHKLGYLPLAIEQSAAYIRETGCSPADYLMLLKKVPLEMLDRASRRRRSFSYQYGDTVYATLKLSLDKVADKIPTAAKLLSLIAFLDPESIPEDSLIEGLKGLSECAELQDLGENTINFNDTISALNSFSLIRRRPGDDSIGLHVLLAEVIQGWLGRKGEGPRWANCAISTLSSAFPSMSLMGLEADNVRQKLIPHVLVCLQHAKTFTIVNENARELFIAAGRHLLNTGVYDGGIRCLTPVLEELKTTCGNDCTKTAEVRVLLSQAYRRAGDWDKAVSYAEEALRVYDNVHGVDYVDSVDALHALGQALTYKLGQPQTATPLYERALKIIENQPEQSHNDLPWLTISLGLALCGNGDWQRAETMLTHAFEFENFKKDQYYAAVAHRAMGRYRYYRRQWSKSRQSFKIARNLREQQLGKDHPDAAGYNCNIGAVLLHEDQLEDAALHFDQAFNLQAASRSEHFAIAYHLSGLGCILAMQGRYEEAKVRYQLALTVREKSSNPAETASTINSLATIYAKQGSPDAEQFFAMALETRKINLGHYHSETLRTMRQFVAYYQVQYRFSDAKGLLEEWLTAEQNSERDGRSFWRPRHVCRVYPAEAYLDDGIFWWAKQGMRLEYETRWSLGRWILYPIWAFMSEGGMVVRSVLLLAVSIGFAFITSRV